VRATRVEPVDPFDLPDWLGEGDVAWHTAATIGSPLVPGSLEGSGESLPCDLLACDRAYPEPVLPEERRREAHSSWALGQVLLVEADERLTHVVPGVEVVIDTALEALRRLAKAVGARPERYAALIRL